MKNGRQRQILKLISEHSIETQEDLINRLMESGYKVTQATVSRDIKELKLIKVQSEDGKSYKYADSVADEPRSNAKFATILTETVVSTDYAMNMAVIKTYNGMAGAAAAALESMHWDGIVGTIAGDDTIMIVMRTEEKAKDITDKIAEIISNR